MYICHSFYSFGYGTLSPEDLVKEAVKRGLKQLVLADILNVAGVFGFVKACRDAQIRPVVGVDFRLGDEHWYTALACSEEGFAEINRHLTAWLESPEAPPALPEFQEVLVIYPFSFSLVDKELKQWEYIGVRAQELVRFAWSIQQHPHLGKKALAWQPVSFIDKKTYNLHRLLRCIHHNILLSKLTTRQQAPATEHFPVPQTMLARFAEYLSLLERIECVLERCVFDPDISPLKSNNKKVFTTDAEEDHRMLSRLAWQGFNWRYGSKPGRMRKRRVTKELRVIKEMLFESYYLITWDIIRFAKSKGRFHVGRGSGANSVVAYCIGITDVDPIEMDLYFERFINKHRNSPPDFDIDFSWDERGEVQNYIFEKYGREHVALLGTLNTYQGRGPIRELGKVFGLPKQEIDQLVERPEQGAETQIGNLILKYGAMMVNIPNHFGIHAGGVIISDKPIFYHTALLPMPYGHPVTQFDMYVAENIGLTKFDILSQRGLGHIREAAEIILENRGVQVDVHDFPRFKNDPAVRDNIRAANTIGCFYIESPAMRQLLGKLRCETYLTLVAASSIIRPGVAKSGMMRMFIHRFHNPDFEYVHPNLKPLLEETYGIMVYQEDVIKVAHYFAGMDLADADVLRRGMSGKARGRSEFDRIRQTFFDNCRKKKYGDAVTNEVWRQIESFAGFSFSKAHSASFAVESYQSLFLKTYYPLEFAVAVINNFGGFYRTEIYVNEARKAGGDVQAPCINQSRHKTRLCSTTVWLGFIHVIGLEMKVIETLLDARERGGPFTSLEDFCLRVGTGLEQVLILIRIGAMRCLSANKKDLMWDAQTLFSKKRALVPPAGHLFEEAISSYALPALSTFNDEDAYDQIDLLGYPLCPPFELIIRQEARGSVLLVKDMRPHKGQRVRMLGYLVATKTVRTVRGDTMCFGCFLDEESAFLDTVHFPPSMQQHPFVGYGVYEMEGRVTEEFDVYALEVTWMERLYYRPDPRSGL